MSKYEPLWEHLKADGCGTFRLVFDEIKDVPRFDIDPARLRGGA